MTHKSKKLWDKGTAVSDVVEKFTIGKDRDLDLFIAEFDVLGSIAHATMLASIGLLTSAELSELKKGLINIHSEIVNGHFSIDQGIEDIHSQVEISLTEQLGEIGKKIHSGRSRNDQVLLDIRLFTRSRLAEIVEEIKDLFDLLIDLSNDNKDILLPGYTHMQVAMPSSFGLWFGAYAESLLDDMIQLHAAYQVVNKNPLGSAAGYGSSFPLNRQMTTELLGFDNLNYNSVYAQMGRGKVERVVSQALASVAETLAKMSMDITIYMSQNFAFISFPDALTTGSSIMPHKKNPDVFEILRAKCNRIKALPNQIVLMTSNLPSGYHRDLQLIKESFIPFLFEISDCLQITHFALKQIKVKKNILDDPRYDYLFTVDAVNELVKKGISFRDAYKQIGEQVEKGVFKKPAYVDYIHEGSIGNLTNDKIEIAMGKVYMQFDFKKWQKKLKDLVK
jgi:argininosuccinate lyase